MHRRNFVLGAGALAAGGGLALGTGAFDSVEAERDVTVSIVDDADSYLGIQPIDKRNGNYARTLANGELAIDLTSSNGNVDGRGVNTNAITGIADIFQIRNQGTRDVEVGLSPLAFGDLDGQLFPPNLEGALAVLLVPQNPDSIGVDIKWKTIWPGVELPVDMSLISIKDLSPGDNLRFHLAAVALPESAIGTSSISDELYVTASEDGSETDDEIRLPFPPTIGDYANNAGVEIDLSGTDLDEETVNGALAGLYGQ